jgi:hypothetical protein
MGKSHVDDDDNADDDDDDEDELDVLETSGDCGLGASARSR